MAHKTSLTHSQRENVNQNNNNYSDISEIRSERAKLAICSERTEGVPTNTVVISLPIEARPDTGTELKTSVNNKADKLSVEQTHMVTSRDRRRSRRHRYK